MTYNIKPNFYAIRLFERMTNTSFLEINDDPILISKVLYCCLVAHHENDFNMTFDEAMISFFPKHIEQLVSDFMKEMNFINQFKADREASNKADDSSIENPENSSPKEEETILFSSIIPILIRDCGLDPKYVLYEMDYSDCEFYIQSSVDKKREDMEEQRFWTYLMMAPHIDGKKIKGPKDLFEFSWEADARKTNAKEKLKVDRQRLIELGIIKENKEEG